MNKIYNPKRDTWSAILERPTKTVDDIELTVKEIFKEVQKKGDAAIAKYTSMFDGVNFEKLEVSNQEIETAIAAVSVELKEAIQLAKKNIEKFHEAQKTNRIEVETIKGVNCWQEKRPIQKVGLYIPGGTAPLFSTVLMLSVPASIAGCKEIVLCSPPDKSGKINPAILYAANLCGVTKILKVGGIQAIAGMTFGTQTIPKVFKIFGPGNQFVTVAKQLATQFGVAIDMPAGPSELLIVADDNAIPAFVASEMEVLPRKEIAEKAIANSKLIFVENDKVALELINEYGPEHFIICTGSDNFYSDGVENAGSVFIGNYTPESAGDYASGTNHTLPTNGYAKNYSGVNLDSFTKSMTFQKISKKGIQNIGKAIEIMAEAEGLQAHKNAVSLRLKAIEDEK
jgi:histidinol dehydrogenase